MKEKGRKTMRVFPKFKKAIQSFILIPETKVGEVGGDEMLVWALSREEFEQFFKLLANPSADLIPIMKKYLSTEDPVTVYQASVVACTLYQNRLQKATFEVTGLLGMSKEEEAWVANIDSDCGHSLGICTLEDLDVHCLLCLKHFPLK